MKFCRSCGNALSQTSSSVPVFNGPIPGRQPSQPMPPMGGFPGTPVGGVPAFGPLGATPAMGSELSEATVPPTLMPQPSPLAALGNMKTSLATPQMRAQGSTFACPRCGTQTPLGFAYCQQCGLQIQGPTESVTNVRARTPSSAPLPMGPKLEGPIDPHAGTIAQDDLGAAALVPGLAQVRQRTPSAAPGPGWGTAVLVNRDGSDGQRYPLGGEYLMLGRAGADIAFDDDRFLARQHARLERTPEGVRIIPLDLLNGVFRKADAPVELVDGAAILLGREVLRFERVEAEEGKGHPLIRHGVALFGSPPRDPWGRLLQLVPSGGYRDVRHLAGEEVVLGREEGDIVFRDDAFMSRRHAAVTWDGRRALITDLGSSNGTFVRISVPTQLKHGDHVRLGDQLLRIELGR